MPPRTRLAELQQDLAILRQDVVEGEHHAQKLNARSPLYFYYRAEWAIENALFACP